MRELELALVVFTLIKFLCPQAPGHIDLYLAKLLPPHQVVPIKDYYDGGRVKLRT